MQTSRPREGIRVSALSSPVCEKYDQNNHACEDCQRCNICQREHPVPPRLPPGLVIGTVKFEVDASKRIGPVTRLAPVLETLPDQYSQ